jgi:hypothetical protein
LAPDQGCYPVTWTTRLRKDAALYGRPPQRTGRRGRPRHKGDRLPCLAKLAVTTAFTQATVTRYGKTAAVHAAASSSPPDLKASRPAQPTSEEIRVIRLAWEDLAA